MCESLIVWHSYFETHKIDALFLFSFLVNKFVHGINWLAYCLIIILHFTKDAGNGESVHGITGRSTSSAVLGEACKQL